ncbi:ras guanine nucleotide exchange factor domain-containing protein [Helicostylum pulchrum]|nr:ras guanine nucleotide exchange factor domain-containing protein [Helicostylum pulchrum]
MLVASGTISKDSLHIKTNNTLRCHHRAMMASLSKLILSCQLCADGTVTDVSRLLSDCHELLVAVRNFISTCESIPVQVNQVDPIILSPQDSMIRRQSSSSIVMDQGIRAKYELQSDLVESLDAYGASMQESMEALMTNLSRNSDSRCSLAVLLFTQYRNFGNQNGQFLSIIEDIAFDQVSKSPMMKELNVAKQKLYDSLGILFFKMQMMTDESIALEKTIWEMQEAAKSIIDAIRLVCDHMSNLVQERNSGSILIGDGSSFLDGPATPDLSYKRSHSLSIETTKVSTKLTNRSSAPVDNNSNNHSMELNLLKERSNSALIENPSKHTSAKLKQFFGDDVPDPLTINTTTTTNSNTNAAAATTPTDRNSNPTLVPSSTSGVVADEHSYLQYDYSPNEIVFTSDGSVKGGTLRALVERMTLHDYLDMNFNNTFLLTYRSFCTSLELLELLQERYKIQPPTDLTPEELEIWHTKKQKLIRLRVFNVLKIWLEQYYYEEDSVILDRLLFFSNTTIKETLSFSAYQLERLIQKRKDACKDLKKLVITQQMDSPDPILPRNLKKFKLLDLDPIEMARQLTLMDFKMYSAIKPVECLDKAWSRDAAASSNNNAAPVAANIQASIDYCNQVTTWVSDEILSQSEVKKRSTQIKYWVNVAERCRMLNNFNTCMAILSAFDNSAVGRLKRTWEMVGARTNHIVSQIRKLMGANRNFNQYRALIHSVNPPCIPFLGIYLQDLTFIEDGNPNFLKTSKDLINFAKRAKTAEVIREMQQYQTMGYQFRMVDEIQVFIMDSLHSIRDEDQLYRESLKLEPKERDDEKITRLLQESGFL